MPGLRKVVIQNQLLRLGRKRASFNHRCIENEQTSESQQGFSALASDSQVDIGSTWGSMGFYVFSIHVPLSFGGLSAAAKILHQPVLNPQTEAFLILAIRTLELSIVLLLLKCPGKPQYDLADFFPGNKYSKQRSWLLASVLGFGVLLLLVFVTSYFAERLLGFKDVNNPFLKEILSSGPSSVAACILVYCVITPLLEEVFSFTVAKNNAADASLQSALDWACGPSGADCGPIQKGGRCYDSSDLQRTASYAFNDYYLNSQDVCSFTNTAALTSLDPSHDNCKFRSSLSATSGNFSGSGMAGSDTADITSSSSMIDFYCLLYDHTIHLGAEKKQREIEEFIHFNVE